MKYELEPYHRDVPDEELLADLRRVAMELGKNRVTAREYNKRGRFWSMTLQKRFGSWLKAADRASLDRTRTVNLKIPNDELLTDLRRVATELGKNQITKDEYNERGRFNVGTLERRFGSWLKAADKIGLIRTRPVRLKISNEELFSNLAELWASLGRQPRYGDLDAGISKFSVNPYIRHFGTWRKALEAFVRWANEVEPSPAPDDNAVQPLAGELSRAPERAAKKTGRRTRREPSLRLKVRVLMRDGNRCKLCGAVAGDGITKLHFDHSPIPWSKGGETVLENLQILCDKCNLGKGNLEPEN
ncbi:MAG: homing endonuclease associated repeat-containing protein [Candidatus Binataceae bacterium]